MMCISVSTVALNSWVGDGYLQLLVDQIAVMPGKEDAFYSRHDYLGELPESGNEFINERWRQKAAAWMIRVIDAYNQDRDIVREWPILVA